MLPPLCFPPHVAPLLVEFKPAYVDINSEDKKLSKGHIKSTDVPIKMNCSEGSVSKLL